jgi:phosphoglycerate dehydrogenase-like enzyme
MRVALSGEFWNRDGSSAWPGFDMDPLLSHPDLECFFIERTERIEPRHIADADALVLLHSYVDESSFVPGGRLALIARFGVGYDMVDVQACTAQGVALVNTPEGGRRPVAVAILTLMFALANRLPTKVRLARMGPPGYGSVKSEYISKGQFFGMGLAGKTLGSVGLGNIGSELFRLAKPLDMRFLAYDPYANPSKAEELAVQLVGLNTLARESDVLAVNCPLTPETHHMVNADLLAAMKPAAYLINTARGPIVDRAALTAALVNGCLAGAGLDHVESQPLDADDPLLAMDNVIVTPVGLAWTDHLSAGNGRGVAEAVLDLLEGRNPRNVVNPAVLDARAWRSRLSAIRERVRG